MPTRLVPLTGYCHLNDDKVRERATQFRDALGRRAASAKYRQYSTDEQRSQAGCSTRRMQRDGDHGLLACVG